MKQIQHFSTLLALIFLSFFAAAQKDSTAHVKKAKSLKFKVCEIEGQVPPLKLEYLASANYLLEVGKKRHFLKNYFFGEYNFSKKEFPFKEKRDFSFCIDPKLWGLLHLSTSFENDLFGEHPEKSHFQVGIKMYLQDYEAIEEMFTISWIGVNYSVIGTAEHRLGKYEITYNFLTNPIPLTKNIALVFQSMGRIRSGHDFHLVQLGFEPKKFSHSILMIGTGQVYLGHQEYFLGLQIALVENHRMFQPPKRNRKVSKSTNQKSTSCSFKRGASFLLHKPVISAIF